MTTELTPKKMVFRERKKPKLKKKTLAKLDLVDYEFEVIDGIKIYNGMEKSAREERERNIAKFNCDFMLSKIVSSVISAQGRFSNISFNEEEKMPFTEIPSKEFKYIVGIGCNFGQIYVFPNPYQPQALSDMISAIYRLEQDRLIISCRCQTPMKTSGIKKLYEELIEDEKFNTIVKKYYNMKPDDSAVKNAKHMKIIKHLNSILNFSNIKVEYIEEVFISAENIIKDKVMLEVFNDHIEKIRTIYKHFVSYAKNCVCFKKTNNIFSSKKIKKHPKKLKRRRQGSGLYFSSQITFDIFNVKNNKLSKIKLFRNGSFQVPGVKSPDMSDLVPVVKELIRFWNYTQDTDMCVDYVISSMRNYKCYLLSESSKFIIKLANMEEILCGEKYKENPDIKISEIMLNPERYSGLLIKFTRPIPTKKNKKITIKILSSGKINFDGGNSELEIMELYYWMNSIFAKHWNKIIYDPSKYIQTVSSDSDEYESIYDSE
jgi:hypothetical protein